MSSARTNLNGLMQLASDVVASSFIFGAVMWIFVEGIRKFPRNPDNSIQAVYTVPTVVALSIFCGALLRKQVLAHRSLRIVCWLVIAFAVLFVPATLLDALTGNGS